MKTLFPLIFLLAGFLLSPLLPGIISRTKAFFAGRKGPSLFQQYYDLLKLLRKNSVYSTSTTWIFRCAPYVNLAFLAGAFLLLPAAGCCNSFFAFQGDLILFLYLLGTGRVLTVLAAFETGSAFEGMGASRECQFSALAELPSITVFLVLILMTKELSLSRILRCSAMQMTLNSGISMLLLAVAIYIVMLTECCRIPVDDPETDLELTMIHEAMILDSSGPDLAAILYASSLKLWLWLSLLAMMLLPELPLLQAAGATLLLIFLGAVSVGCVESMMARYRFLKVPQLLIAAFCMAFLAGGLFIILKNGGVL